MNRLILLVAFVASVTGMYAQDAKAQGILDKLSAKIKDQKSFYIEFKASITNSSSGKNESFTGKGWVKGKKFFANYGENTIISNGTKTWNVVKEEGTAYETSVDDDDSESMNPKKLMTVWEKGFTNKYEKEEKLGDEMVHVIYLYPKDKKSAEYSMIILYIGKDDNELKKTILKSNDGTKKTISITKFTSNPTIEDSKFTFDAKKYGVSVVKD
jgi:outer membrane lipoprotein-sorting protein